MHKRETFKIVLITLGVLAVIVINAIIFTEDEPDILDIPQTVEAKKPVPNFSTYTDVKEKKEAFFNYLRPEVEKQNAYLLTLRHYVQTLYRKALANESLSEEDMARLEWLEEEYRVKPTQPLKRNCWRCYKKLMFYQSNLYLFRLQTSRLGEPVALREKAITFLGCGAFLKGVALFQIVETMGRLTK